ncbi:hypothetical protein KR009_002281 [Drosophila setifemur]|nr:hypothetical protein KR009_002281 [Drosophila setifemur]
MDCGFLELQPLLSAALEKRDLRQFTEALDKGAQADSVDKGDQGTIYEKALSTAGCGDFIAACIAHGSSANYVNNKNKAAVSFATDSTDPGNLKVLLNNKGVQVDSKYGNLTPLNSLAKKLKAENASAVYECMELLLNYGASPNLVDQGEFTPLNHVLRKKMIPKEERLHLVQLFLAHPLVDIDRYRNGEVRQLLQTQFPELRLPAQRETGTEEEIDCERLLSTLRNGDEERFEQQFAKYQENLSDNQFNSRQGEHLSLLEESVKLGKQRALEAILSTGANINATAGKANNASVVELAAIWGNHRALDRLLKHPSLQLAPNAKLLNNVISRLEGQPYDFCDYKLCFKHLLESDRVDINETDTGGMVPLAYAVKYRNTWAIRELLQHGAYIGAKSRFGDLPIEDIAPEVLEEHLDSCITTNGKKAGEPDYEVVINYKNLVPQEANPSPTSALPNQLHDEMTSIAHIAKSKELRHLLQHPLISSFLFLKWHRLSVIFYLNFLLYSLFTISITTHTLLKFHESDHTALIGLFGLLSWLGIGYIILREAIQLLMSPGLYFRSVINWMELALIVLSILTSSEATYDKETQRVLAVFTILLVAMELCLLVGSLPVLSISTHMLMLREVSRSFVKIFGLYSIFVVTFSMCFYILFGKPPLDDQTKPTASPSPSAEGEPEGDGDFNTFSKPIEALIKTIVMLTGEFDAGDIKFTSIYTYLIFLLFVFFMTIVLFNLLNGLAVSDTQAIKAQAELNGAICRTNLLTRYEEVLTGRQGRGGFILRSRGARSICQRLMNVYPNYLSLRQISVRPNEDNQVLIPISNPYELKTLDGKAEAGFHKLPTSVPAAHLEHKLLDPPLRLLPCCCSVLTGKCSRIDGRTVKLALAIIDRKSSSEQRSLSEQMSDRRLLQIEQKLEHLVQLLQERN